MQVVSTHLALPQIRGGYQKGKPGSADWVPKRGLRRVFSNADMYQYRPYFQMLVWVSSLSARCDLFSSAIKRLVMRTKIEHKRTISKTEAIMTDILRDIAAFFSVSLFLASMALIVSSL